VFMCKNDESRSFNGVYFIPCLTTNIVSVGQLNEIGYKIDIDTGMMKIRKPGGVLLAKVKREVNRLYLLHLMFAQPTCLVVRARGDYAMIVEESTPPMTSLNFGMNMGISMK
jgi:hypothetical protein